MVAASETSFEAAAPETSFEAVAPEMTHGQNFLLVFYNKTRNSNLKF